MAADDTAPVDRRIDARHDHVYLQVFGPGGRTLTPPRLASLREAVEAAAADAVLYRRLGGAGGRRRDGAGGIAAAAVEQRGAPDIAWVARMGAVVPEGQSPPKPLYLRAPDAQPQNAAQLPRR